MSSAVVKATYDKTKPGVALVPPFWWTGGEHRKAQYVRLITKSCSESLQVAKRHGAKGTEVWVSPGVLDLPEGDSVEVTISEITRIQFRSDQLFKSKDGWLALAGLGATVLGLAIPLTFSFGDTFFVLFTMSSRTESIVRWFSPFLGLAGVLLVFMRGVWLRGG